MLTELCAYLRNYFLVDYLHPEERIHYGTYTIEQGHFVESPSFLSDGQYFRIVGSLFNDGVYCYGKDELMDETFTGSIWAMSVPPEVSALANDISAWIVANSQSLSSPYQSESFGGYSYSKSSGGGSSGNPSAAYSWQDQFASRLAPYRRLSVL
jgi:hypothetical protein